MGATPMYHKKVNEYDQEIPLSRTADQPYSITKAMVGLFKYNGNPA